MNAAGPQLTAVAATPAASNSAFSLVVGSVPDPVVFSPDWQIEVADLSERLVA